MRQRLTNFALLKMDFKDTTFMKTRVVERMPLGDKIGSAGGLIGKFSKINLLATILSSLYLRNIKDRYVE